MRTERNHAEVIFIRVVSHTISVSEWMFSAQTLVIR